MSAESKCSLWTVEWTGLDKVEVNHLMISESCVTSMLRRSIQANLVFFSLIMIILFSSAVLVPEATGFHGSNLSFALTSSIRVSSCPTPLCPSHHHRIRSTKMKLMALRMKENGASC